MKMESVNSTSIAAFAYDARSRTLWVEFRNGGLYEYGSVPQRIVKGLRSAESKGRFVNRFIRTSYPYRRIH